MIPSTAHIIRVAIRRDPVGQTSVETHELVVRASDRFQALDLAIFVARREFNLTPYDEVSVTPEV